MKVRTRLAKTAYFLGGLLYKVRVPQRFFSWDSATGEFVPQPRRRWSGCPFGIRIGLGWSERLDPVHWEHWAYAHKHEDCGAVPCPACGGWICGDIECQETG